MVFRLYVSFSGEMSPSAEESNVIPVTETALPIGR